MKKFFGYTAAAALAGLMGLSATSASAVTGSCSVGNVSYTLSSVAANDANNVFCTTGNDSGTSLTVFGMTYTLGDKQPDNEGDGTVFFTDAPTAGESSPGSWAVDTNLGPGETLSSLVIVLKQSNSFAAFMVDSLSGEWTTSGPGQSSMDLSHGSAWYKIDTTVIPLPGALPLMIGALGGLGLLGWRRRQA